MDFIQIILIISPIISIIGLIIFLIIFSIRKKYTNFVKLHSVALKNLKEINKHYGFKKIPNMDMYHSYDNENMYEDISCLDYLTYNLRFKQKEVNLALKNALDNKLKLPEYDKEVESISKFDNWDTDSLLSNRKRLIKYEKRLFKKNIKNPDTTFNITVNLKLTNINGAFKTGKSKTFGPKVIKDTIAKLNQRRGNFYTNDDVWQSICRVERGKVTNKMRFAIYERDHHRCRKCGRRTNDLEIDHIIPIAKGGKSTFDNLQTLCHRCNVKKGANIE